MQFGGKLDPNDPRMVLLCRGEPPEPVVRLDPQRVLDLIEVLKSLHEQQMRHVSGERIQLVRVK
jgi:hypothetical protein